MTAIISSAMVWRQFGAAIDDLGNALRDCPDALWEAAQTLDVELVLTAHPTEVSRRTLIQKYDAIADGLERLDHEKLTPSERQAELQKLRRHIIAAWRTDEIRRQRPTPVDEAKWGFATIEQTLWQAVPEFLREFDAELRRHAGRGLPLTKAPLRFASWMGGDRDGNPTRMPVRRQIGRAHV